MSIPKGLKHAVHLDDTVKRLISDESLVTDVQLQQSRWVSPVQDCFIRARPKTWLELKHQMPIMTALMIRQGKVLWFLIAHLEQGSVRSRKWLLLNLRAGRKSSYEQIWGGRWWEAAKDQLWPNIKIKRSEATTTNLRMLRIRRKVYHVPCSCRRDQEQQRGRGRGAEQAESTCTLPSLSNPIPTSFCLFTFTHSIGLEGLSGSELTI